MWCIVKYLAILGTFNYFLNTLNNRNIEYKEQVNRNASTEDERQKLISDLPGGKRN